MPEHQIHSPEASAKRIQSSSEMAGSSSTVAARGSTVDAVRRTCEARAPEDAGGAASKTGRTGVLSMATIPMTPHARLRDVMTSQGRPGVKAVMGRVRQAASFAEESTSFGHPDGLRRARSKTPATVATWWGACFLAYAIVRFL